MSIALNKLLLLAVLALFFGSAFAEVHRWVDENGVVHYSDTPVADTESELIQIDPTVPKHTDDSVSELTEWLEERAEYRAEARQERSAAEQVEEQEHKARQQRCVNARQQLISLEQRLPVYRDEEGKFRTRSRYDVYEGKREYLDATTRALEIDRVQQELNATCDHPDDPKEWYSAAWKRMQLKRCETARLLLNNYLRPEARSARQDIEQAHQSVEKYCEESVPGT